MEERLPRKLAAILYADVAGYSRLTGEDEDATHRTLRDYLDLIASTIDSHHGQVMHYAGDAVLAQFGAVLDSLSCAVTIQNELQARNEALPDERRVRFRIGVNSGDVIKDRGDIYGDGVNVAARLEALAEPGGICISDAVRTAIGNKLPYEYVYIGEQCVKNIAEPVRAYRIFEHDVSPTTSSPKSLAALPLPPVGKPSLVIKPFANLSADPEQDYFAEGLSSNIMIALVRIPGLFLVEDESPSYQLSKQIPAQKLGRQLGARYVLKGGVHKHDDRVRVNAELIEVSSGQHLWAERFDRELRDVFAIQDEITEEIVTAMDVKLLAGDDARFVRGVISNPEALDCLYRGQYLQYGSPTKLDFREIHHLFEEAMRLEPTSSLPIAIAAMAHLQEFASGLSDTPLKTMDRAIELANKALELNDRTGYAHLILAHMHLSRREYDEAMAEANQAVSDRPSCNGAYCLKANVLNYLGRSAEAIELAQYAVRLTPVHPPWYPAILANAYHGCDRYEEAITAAKASIGLNDRNVEPFIMVAASNAALGRTEEAGAAGQEIMKVKPQFNLADFAKSQPYKNQKALDRLIAQLNSAGLA